MVHGYTQNKGIGFVCTCMSCPTLEITVKKQNASLRQLLQPGNTRDALKTFRPDLYPSKFIQKCSLERTTHRRRFFPKPMLSQTYPNLL